MGINKTFNQEIEKISLGHDATRCAVVQITVTVEFGEPMTAVGLIGGTVMEVARGLGGGWTDLLKSNMIQKVCVHVEGIDVFGSNGAFIASEKELNEVFDGKFGRPVWGVNPVIEGVYGPFNQNQDNGGDDGDDDQDEDDDEDSDDESDEDDDSDDSDESDDEEGDESDDEDDSSDDEDESDGDGESGDGDGDEGYDHDYAEFTAIPNGVRLNLHGVTTVLTNTMVTMLKGRYGNDPRGLCNCTNCKLWRQNRREA